MAVRVRWELRARCGIGSAILLRSASISCRISEARTTFSRIRLALLPHGSEVTTNGDAGRRVPNACQHKPGDDIHRSRPIIHRPEDNWGNCDTIRTSDDANWL